MIMLMIKKIKEGDSENNILILQYTVLKITFTEWATYLSIAQLESFHLHILVLVTK